MILNDHIYPSMNVNILKDSYLVVHQPLTFKHGRIAADGVSKITRAGSIDKSNQESYSTILIVCKKPSFLCFLLDCWQSVFLSK